MLFERGNCGTYGWVIVCEGVVDSHVFKEPSDMLVKEALDFFKIELRVDKDCTYVCFNNIG
jgi:hypothetical protein